MGFKDQKAQKNSQLRAQSREFEKLWTSKLWLCAMTAFFLAKDPFSKETIQASTKDHHFPGSTLLMKLGQVEYHSKLLLQLAVPNDTVELPRILATAVVASCGFVFNVSAAVRPMTTLMGCCSVVCPRRGGVQHGSCGATIEGFWEWTA